MNILHVVRPAEGGMKNHVTALMENLDHSRYNMFLAGPGANDWQAELQNQGIQYIPLPLKGEISPWHDLGSMIKLANIIKRNQIHIVHTHGMKASLVGRGAVQLARRISRISGYREHRIDPFVIAAVHNSVYNYGMPEYKKRFIAFLQRRLAKNTHRFVTVSQALKNEITNWENIPEDFVRVIYNGISPENFQKQKSPLLKMKLGLNPVVPVVGTIARLAPQKGIKYFIQGAALLTQVIDRVQFLIVGDGPLKKKLEYEAEQLGIREKIIFTGYYSDISQIYPLIDVFVVPSLSEGLSITTIEAMAAHRPIVACAVGGIPELISHRQNGYLVPPENHQALAQGILELLKRPKWAEKLAHAAWKKAQSNFTVDVMIKETDRLYREAAEEMGISDMQGRFAHAGA
ncbi:MAG: glycosyltransferase family 4 protein [Bacillota bacterium]|jgi:glycosyltransferase involved in cell wall biosynthesis